LGAIHIPRSQFLDELALALELPTFQGTWSFPK